jgi:hypothetical protein
VTFWVRVVGPEPKRKNRAVHADRECYALNQHITAGPVVEVPMEFVEAFSPCARCVVTGRWVAIDQVPDGLGEWWQRIRFFNEGVR